MEQELIPLREARQRLGISKTTMTRRIREWELTLYENPADKRESLVAWQQIARHLRPTPKTTTVEDEGQEGKAAA